MQKSLHDRIDVEGICLQCSSLSLTSVQDCKSRGDEKKSPFHR